MPPRSKGPRLYLRRDRVDRRSGRPLPDVYVIRDGSVQRSTGCGADRLSEAERQLGEYIARKQAAAALTPAAPQDPTTLPVATVLALYAQERAPQLAGKPESTAGFIRALLGFWGDKTVADVKRTTCMAYVAWRTAQSRGGASSRGGLISEQTARRELETLQGALSYWDGEHQLARKPRIWLPEKPESPRSALTRSEAAALLLAARGWRKTEDGRWVRLYHSTRANRAHVARFILLALYTGSRSGVILDLSWEKSAVSAWVDLERGILYRRGTAERDHHNKRRPPARLPGRLLGHLRRWRKMDLRREAVLREADPTARLIKVIHHGGEAIDKINRGFNACRRDAALADDVTPHWLRHTAATWLMERGVDLWLAANYLGMSVATLEKHYGHHRLDFQATASGRIASAV